MATRNRHRAGLQTESGWRFLYKFGLPGYFLTILGVWKILGVAALLIPKFVLLQEWAYAGFFFAMSEAAFSHIASGTVNEIFPSLLLLILMGVSWYFSPADREIILVNQ